LLTAAAPWDWIPGLPAQVVGVDKLHREKVEGELFRRQIHRADLQAIKPIGAGQFGAVYLANQVGSGRCSCLVYPTPARPLHHPAAPPIPPGLFFPYTNPVHVHVFILNLIAPSL